MFNFIDWLASTSGSIALRESLYMYPWIESAHVLFITIFFGTLLFVDLRLTGYGFKNLSISQMNSKILPLTLIGFIFMITHRPIVILCAPCEKLSKFVF